MQKTKWNSTVSKQIEELFDPPKKQAFSTSFFLLLLCYLFPFTLTWGMCFRDKWSAQWIVCSLVAFGGVFGAVLYFWQRSVRNAASFFVKKKMQQLRAIDDSEDLVEAYQEEIKKLHIYIEETCRGYEHQIDLLQSSAAKSKEKAEELSCEMDKKLEEVRMAYLEFEDLRKEYERLDEEYKKSTKEFQEKLCHKDRLLAEYQHTIAEQRAVLKKKQHGIVSLEEEVHHLMNEVKNLLQAKQAKENTPPPAEQGRPQTAEEAFSPTTSHHGNLSSQLQRYLEMAKNFTGVKHLGYVGGESPRFLDLTDSYAIDLRRLFDVFREETTGIIFVYSQIEERFLFVNNFVKMLLGWSPEKFAKDFSILVEKGYAEWQKCLGWVSSDKESQLYLVFKSRSGDKMLFQGVMRIVSQGPFVNHVIGIFAPKEESLL